MPNIVTPSMPENTAVPAKHAASRSAGARGDDEWTTPRMKASEVSEDGPQPQPSCFHRGFERG